MNKGGMHNTKVVSRNGKPTLLPFVNCIFTDIVVILINNFATVNLQALF